MINIKVHAVPLAAFTTGPQCKGIPVGFTNNSTINSTDSLFYNWNFGDNTNSTLNNPTHIYNTTGSIPIQLITTSNYGCKDTITHYNSIYTLPIIQFNKQNVSCNGLTDGMITASVTSGNPTYHYLWSNTSTSSIINNLLPGTYVLTVTDTLGCVDKDTTIITQPNPITLSYNKKSYVCNGMNNGWIKAIVQGGTSPFLFNWSGGLTGDSIFYLNNGNYFLTVKDSNNCQKTDSVFLIAKSQPSLTFSHTDVLCYGNNTGTAGVTANGGVAPYNYQWQTAPLQLIQNIQNLVKGSYTVKVSDSLGCLKTDSVFINQPDSFSNSVIYTLPLCNGNNNGKITVNTSGATAPYMYSWNTTPIQNTSVANNLTSGTYQLIIKDGNNCLDTLSLTLNQPDKIGRAHV